MCQAVRIVNQQTIPKAILTVLDQTKGYYQKKGLVSSDIQ